LATADKRLSEIPETTDSYQRFLLRHERDVIDNKKQIRLANGMEIEMILNGEEFSALDLEELFSRVSSAVCHYPKLHGGIATRLGETFTPKQRQVLGYLFWNTLRNAKVPLTVTTLGAS